MNMQEMSDEMRGREQRAASCWGLAILPLNSLSKERRGCDGYQPMSLFCKHEKGTGLSPLVKMSPSWPSVAIFVSSIFCGLSSSRNQW